MVISLTVGDVPLVATIAVTTDPAATFPVPVMTASLLAVLSVSGAESSDTPPDCKSTVIVPLMVRAAPENPTTLPE